MLLKICNRNITCNKSIIITFIKKINFFLNLEHIKLKLF